MALAARAAAHASAARSGKLKLSILAASRAPLMNLGASSAAGVGGLGRACSVQVCRGLVGQGRPHGQLAGGTRRASSVGEVQRADRLAEAATSARAWTAAKPCAWSPATPSLRSGPLRRGEVIGAGPQQRKRERLSGLANRPGTRDSDDESAQPWPLAPREPDWRGRLDDPASSSPRTGGAHAASQPAEAVYRARTLGTSSA